MFIILIAGNDVMPVFQLECITPVARAIKFPSLHLETVGSNLSTIADLESSTEPLLGFSDYGINLENTKQLNGANINDSIQSNNSNLIAEDTNSVPMVTNRKSKSKKPEVRKSIDDNSKNPKRKETSRNQSTSKRSTKYSSNETEVIEPLTAENCSSIPNDTIDVNTAKEIDPSDIKSELDLDHENIESTICFELLFDDKSVIAPIPTVITNKNRNQNIIDSTHYYRKTFKKTMEQAVEVDRLVNEWDDSENEQEKKSQNVCLTSADNSENDDLISIISVASGTSDSSFAFIGEPYFDSNTNKIDD